MDKEVGELDTDQGPEPKLKTGKSFRFTGNQFLVSPVDERFILFSKIYNENFKKIDFKALPFEVQMVINALKGMLMLAYPEFDKGFDKTGKPNPKPKIEPDKETPLFKSLRLYIQKHKINLFQSIRGIMIDLEIKEKGRPGFKTSRGSVAGFMKSENSKRR